MEIVDFTEEFRGSKFKVFKDVIASQGVVKALNAKGLAGATQGQMDTVTEIARSFGAKGLAFIKVEGGEDVVIKRSTIRWAGRLAVSFVDGWHNGIEQSTITDTGGVNSCS